MYGSMGVWEYGSGNLSTLKIILFKILNQKLRVQNLNIAFSLPYSHTPILSFGL
jgi:hypothetical protein